MRVLLLGSDGLIGQQLYNSCIACGIAITPFNRRQLDFNYPNMDLFNEELANVTVIVNAVGIMSNDNVLMETIHHHTPALLASTAKTYAKNHHKTLHWINISAIGADADSEITFIGSKGRGDKAILALMDGDFKVTIVRPSLIFSPNGVSSRLFLQIAKFPLWLLPDKGRFVIQPVALDDVVLGILNLIRKGHQKPIINFVGRTIYFYDYLSLLRKHYYHKNASKTINIPIKIIMAILKLSMVRLLINLYFHKYSSLLSWQNLQLLNDGLVYSSDDFLELLGKDIKTAEQFTQHKIFKKNLSGT